MSLSFTVSAKVIEIAPAVDYTVVRYVLSNITENCSSGDVFNIIVSDATGINVDDVTNLTFTYPAT